MSLATANAVAGGVLAFVVGAAIGIVTTFAHRSYPVDIGATVPLGLAIGLAVIAALVAAFRLVWPGRAYAVAAGAGVLAALAALALPLRRGSILLLDDPAGWTWSIAPVVIVLAAILWPRPRRRSRPRAG